MFENPQVLSGLLVAVSVVLLLTWAQAIYWRHGLTVWRGATMLKQKELDSELENISSLEQAVALWKETAANEERRRAEVIKVIVIVTKERDGWHNLYLQCSREHGVAQDIMIQEIQHLQRQIRAHGVKTEENMRARNVSDEFRKRYLDPQIGLGSGRGTDQVASQKQLDLGDETLAVLPRG